MNKTAIATAAEVAEIRYHKLDKKIKHHIIFVTEKIMGHVRVIFSSPYEVAPEIIAVSPARNTGISRVMTALFSILSQPRFSV
ncbi:hypothetical protein J5I95_13660 [Candidatus Poribacteria bacterium]|nr:hypothetical protein [Candidatus Poribacteria bacterium]